MSAEWWRCHAHGEHVPGQECDVLAASPEIAATEYATQLHREEAPDLYETLVLVTVYDPETGASREYQVTSTRRYVGRVQP